ncbi:MAG: thioredoxin family protein [Rhodobacteraceae bacterium]|nr:thioredoxin family protein [Paracoccaceae bacterium]
MKTRRHFLAATAGGALALATPSLLLAGEAMIPYAPEVLRAAEARGQAVLLDFFAPWCSTCRAQGRVLQRLRASEPAYDAAIAFVVVDWDTHRGGPLVQEMEIPRRSTLVLMRGETEIGRLVAETREAPIRALLDRALSA